jgi:hypothetical protein
MIFSGHQPNFLPYMGVFYKMYRSDVFVLDDDVQYSNKGLHNANYLKVNGQKYKMTVPVSYNHGELINQVLISYAENWMEKLLKTIKNSYGKAPHFEEGYDLIKRHLEEEYEKLVDLNTGLIYEIAERFGLKTQFFIASQELYNDLSNNDRNIRQCLDLGADVYYSGVGGKEYNDEEAYRKNGIKIVYSDYEPLKYRQGRTEFIENLSVLDYVFYRGFEIPEEWR